MTPMIRLPAAFVLLTLLCAWFSSAAAESVRSCKESLPKERPSSIDELMEQSDYIGLYTVVRSKEKKSKLLDGNQIERTVFEFELSLISSVSSNAPLELSLIGTKSSSSIPQAYFFIGDRHQELVRDNNLLLGLTYRIKRSDGYCMFLPEFVDGYNYLIFGGANSSAAFEPILSTRYDAFYNEVVRKVAAQH